MATGLQSVSVMPNIAMIWIRLRRHPKVWSLSSRRVKVVIDSTKRNSSLDQSLRSEPQNRRQ
ncbi:unnamed protein product [Medioppia subpectinata]|uniref:Uncharacterized protein n=1 Tax=Medioppia subpectinata TaxID=1979941 RepID=A0A7R9LR80_9ACAR|nr:unnamed protein product [Medioppia subpectinata]CAG2120697.1 unnamed protein product [Medioppia subpectinata]